MSSHQLIDAPEYSGPEVFLGSIDQGTTSTRFIIFNKKGEIVAKHQQEFPNYYPEDGYHEQNPYDLYNSVQDCIVGAVKEFTDKGYNTSSIKCVGITNQRETTTVWDITTGKPIRNAIVWTDTRTRDLVRKLKKRPGAAELGSKCGMPLSTYPSSVKLRWMLDNDSKVRGAYEDGLLAFGTVDTWMIWCLNGGISATNPVHVTDSSNASRTMFMDLVTMDYCPELLKFFGIDRKKIHLPRICPSSSATDYGAIADGPLAGVPIMGCLGDQSAALVGQRGFQRGQAKNTYGTGCFLLYNVGHKPVISTHGLLTTVAYDFGEGKRAYALEGSVAVAGSGLTWLTKNLGVAPSSIEAANLAETVTDNGGVYFVTAFSGLFAPYWVDDAKGTLWGMSQFTNKGHIARATIEAICFQSKAILDAMAQDSGSRLASLAVDGGVSNSDLAMQTQADLSGIPVCRPQMRETTALGAAIAAGLAAGVYDSISDLENVNAHNLTTFKPKMKLTERKRQFSKWSQAVEMSKGWDTGNYATRNSEDSSLHSEADREALAQEIVRDICCLDARCAHGRDFRTNYAMEYNDSSNLMALDKWKSRHWIVVVFVLMMLQYMTLTVLYWGGNHGDDKHTDHS
ncbi:Glycerol kinase [Ceratocystis pirilliformis]|uniref:glycerol kinase n=1 Tax=Ceratocystis pirilliformis TaxID=259994 RepID=A0ABR3YXS0_9PEZI